MMFQPLQRLIQRQKIMQGLVTGGEGKLIQVQSLRSAAMPQTPLPPCGFDEDSAHRLGSGGEKMPAAVPLLDSFATHQANVRLVDERRRLKCLAGRFVREPLCGQSSQFVIDQWQELPRRGGITLVSGCE